MSWGHLRIAYVALSVSRFLTSPWARWNFSSIAGTRHARIAIALSGDQQKGIAVKRVLCVLAVLACSATAHAVPVTYLGEQYDVTTVGPSRYEDPGVASLLQSQVWWGSDAIATIFSDQVNEQLGAFSFGVFGPMFATNHFASTLAVAWDFDDNRTETWLLGSNTHNTWAVAQRITKVPEPGTLGLLVIGLFTAGVARRRKSTH